MLQPAKTPRKRGESVGVNPPLSNVLQDLFERPRGLAIQCMRVGLVLLAHAHGVDDDETILDPRSGTDHAELVGGDDAHSATFHLLEESGGLNVTQEEYALD